MRKLLERQLAEKKQPYPEAFEALSVLEGAVEIMFDNKVKIIRLRYGTNQAHKNRSTIIRAAACSITDPAPGVSGRLRHTTSGYKLGSAKWVRKD